jgi:hypothetical protein
MWMQQQQQKNIAATQQAVGVCSQQGKRPYQEDEFSVSEYHISSPFFFSYFILTIFPFIFLRFVNI